MVRRVAEHRSVEAAVRKSRAKLEAEGWVFGNDAVRAADQYRHTWKEGFRTKLTWPYSYNKTWRIRNARFPE